MKHRREIAAGIAAFLVVTGISAQAIPCRPGQAPTRGVLGIGAYHCIGGPCWIHDAPDTAWFQFSSEPIVRDLAARSPALQAGLRDGDVLVALDDAPITLASTGRRLANLRPGQAIKLTFHRNERTLNATLIPAPGCQIPGLVVSQTDAWPIRGTAEYSRDPGPPRTRSDSGSGGLQRQIRVGDVDVRVFGSPVRITTDSLTGDIIITTFTNVLRLRPHIQ